MSAVGAAEWLRLGTSQIKSDSEFGVPQVWSLQLADDPAFTDLTLQILGGYLTTANICGCVLLPYLSGCPSGTLCSTSVQHRDTSPLAAASNYHTAGQPTTEPAE